MKLKLYIKQLGTRIFERLPRFVQAAFVVTKNSVVLLLNHNTVSLGAGLSYFTLFSLAPMLIIMISVVGLIFGPDAVTGQLRSQLESLLGTSTADQLQTIVKATFEPKANWIATGVSVALVLYGAIGVFDQIRTSLNVIWDVKPTAKKRLWTYFIDRLFSFGMIATITFLLIVSLALNAAMTALSAYLNHLLPEVFNILIATLDILISFGLTTLLFMFIYRFLSDIKIAWKSVFLGAMFTSLLFALGKYLVAFFIGTHNLGSTYGAAASVVVVLIWVFYMSQILFFGAAFTKALAAFRGIKIAGTVDPRIPKR